MRWWEVIIHIFGILFCYFAYLKCYSLAFKVKPKTPKIIEIFAYIFLAIIAYCNTFYNYGFSKIIISFFEIFIVLKIFYKNNMKDTFIRVSILYLLGWILELIFSAIFIYFVFYSVQQIDQNLIVKALFSIVMMLALLLCCYNNKIKKILNSIYNYMDKVLNLTIIIIFFIISLVVLSYYLIVTTDAFSSVTIILLLVVLVLLFTTSIIQVIKSKKAEEKQEILLTFMKEYEILIDNERIARHETVNNLLTLKSIKNKNTKEYNKILEEMLESYKTKRTFRGIYELPSGLKGLFYYKIYDMKNKNIEVFMNVSDKMVKNLDELSSKTLSRLCKILGILLDNAREAAEKSKEKLVVIDAYKENNELIVYIENTMCKEKLDINKLKEKGFSTKGKNRGYGLFLIDKVLNETNKIEFSQKIENSKFISIVKIKK